MSSFTQSKCPLSALLLHLIFSLLYSHKFALSQPSFSFMIWRRTRTRCQSAANSFEVSLPSFLIFSLLPNFPISFFHAFNFPPITFFFSLPFSNFCFPLSLLPLPLSFSLFVKGTCEDVSCPFSHVYVSPDADVCTAFLQVLIHGSTLTVLTCFCQGYCPSATLCPFKHVTTCDAYRMYGKCPKVSPSIWFWISIDVACFIWILLLCVCEDELCMIFWCFYVVLLSFSYAFMCWICREKTAR